MPRRFLLDISPLRYDRSYRWLWLGQLISSAGRQITLIALPYQLYRLTGSALALGGLAAVTLIGLVIFSIPAGSLADAVDRRRLLIVTQLGLAGTSLALAGIALLDRPPVAIIYAVAFIAAAISSVDHPTRRATMSRLVAPERLPAALVLDQASFQTSSIVGPAVGGALIAAAGVPIAFLIDALTFGAALAAVVILPALPPIGGGVRPGLSSVVEGFRHVRRVPVILASFVVDLVAMVFGLPTALFPILALTTYGGDATTLGLLTAAPAVGALIGALTSGWVSHVRRQGRAIIVAVALWGVAITLFGIFVTWLPLALFFLAIAGAADVISAVFRSALIQLATPDALRGRLSSLHVLVVTGGPRLGDIESAGVAAFAGAQVSAIVGGVLCLVGLAAVAIGLPELDRYTVEPFRPVRVSSAGDSAPAEVEPKPEPEPGPGPAA